MGLSLERYLAKRLSRQKKHTHRLWPCSVFPVVSFAFASLPFWFEICVRGLPQTLIRSACNLNMLSIVSGQEAGKQDERDRKECEAWYDAVSASSDGCLS